MNNTPNTPDRSSAASPRHPDNRPTENKFVAQLKRPVVFIPLILLFCLLGLFLYMQSQLSNVRKQATRDQAAVVQNANQRITENNRYLLRVLTKPFSWALRTSLLAGNQEQVDQYLFQFVQEEKFSLVLVADPNGTIISSTDQNYTGSAFANHFDAGYLSADSAVVDESTPGRVLVVTPIMGFNNRLGTLLAVYMPGEPLQAGQQQE